MKIEKLSFTEKLTPDLVWNLKEFSIGQINLIVGRNATGKSRTLSVINSLANLVSGNTMLSSLTGRCDFEVHFINDKKKIRYLLSYQNSKIIKEEFWSDNERKLEREFGKTGKVYAEEIKKYISFQIPDDQLACFAKSDEIQHPYLKELSDWGKNSRFYPFGTSLGREALAIFTKDIDKINVSPKDSNAIVSLFKKGLSKYGDELKKTIIKEMNEVGFCIDDMDVAPLEVFSVNAPGEVQCVVIKESDLPGKTYQVQISQGMFRALSLIIQINISILDQEPSCILIDDIGEGLDYERSTGLIKLIIEKVRNTNIQILMSSNDRFVMNAVPLEYWSVIQRSGDRINIFNYRNSKKEFDDFKYTGLANFDFLKTEFYSKGFDQ